MQKHQERFQYVQQLKVQFLRQLLQSRRVGYYQPSSMLREVPINYLRQAAILQKIKQTVTKILAHARQITFRKATKIPHK